MARGCLNGIRSPVLTEVFVVWDSDTNVTARSMSNLIITAATGVRNRPQASRQILADRSFRKSIANLTNL